MVLVFWSISDEVVLYYSFVIQYVVCPVGSVFELVSEDVSIRLDRSASLELALFGILKDSVDDSGYICSRCCADVEYKVDGGVILSLFFSVVFAPSISLSHSCVAILDSASQLDHMVALCF